jgi:hypothetical protein
MSTEAWTAEFDAEAHWLTFTLASAARLRFRVSVCPSDLCVDVSVGGGPFRPHHGDIGTVLLSRGNLWGPKKTDVRRKFFDSLIPRDVRLIVADGPPAWRFGGLRLGMSREGCQLARQSEPLFWCVAAELTERHAPGTPLVWLRKPRRELLGLALGTEPVPASRLALLRKIIPHRVIRDAGYMKPLLDFLADGELTHALRHQRLLPLPVISLAVRYKEHVLNHEWMRRALAEASDKLADVGSKTTLELVREERQAESDIADLVDRFELIQRALYETPFDAFRTARSRRQLRRTLETFDRARAADPSLDALPGPPLVGGDGITPITTVREALLEGYWMRNCVPSLVGDVRAGVMYLYRVESPRGERATLSVNIQPSPNGGPDVVTMGDLLASANRPVDPATREFVQAWLRSRTGRA